MRPEQATRAQAGLAFAAARFRGDLAAIDVLVAGQPASVVPDLVENLWASAVVATEFAKAGRSEVEQLVETFIPGVGFDWDVILGAVASKQSDSPLSAAARGLDAPTLINGMLSVTMASVRAFASAAGFADPAAAAQAIAVRCAGETAV